MPASGPGLRPIPALRGRGEAGLRTSAKRFSGLALALSALALGNGQPLRAHILARAQVP